ncbi:MAG TPA: S41 family peptidase [Sphingomicrobium sp.]
MTTHLQKLLLLSVIALPGIITNPASAQARQFAPAALQADLRFAIDTIERQHPDLTHSVTRARLDAAVERVRQQLDQPMDQTRAWTILAQLNPVLADAHLFIGLPDWRTKSAEAVRAGTVFFPFEITLDAAGYPVVVSALGGSATPLAGRRIRSIDGRDARDVARTLLARVHGDTPAFRAALLSRRWWLFFSSIYGTPATYDFVLKGSRKQHRVPAASVLPAVLQQDASFERQFACQTDVRGTARLKVAAFSWEDKQRFFRFTRDCFARIRSASIKRLVIDVSANGGGDDDMWKDGILRYIATEPYKQGSTYRKRERTGAITTGAIETATNPVSDEPLHFSGDVSVVIGPLTYSSAVLFSNVVRDYRMGTLVGTGGTARTRQSGGVQNVKLPNTGLLFSYPRFVLDPPSGTKAPTYLQPTVRGQL